MVTDEDLLHRSLEGDATAFGALVGRHESAVCAVSFAVTGDRETSEDVAQDAFLAAWRSLSSLREPARFRAWACGIARNLANKARTMRARTRELQADAVDSTPNPEELLDARDRERAVWAALERLSPTYREPLVLFYREGRSTAEVAEALSLSVSTVAQRLSRGRNQLRAEVMDMVEQTLEDRPPRGRISAAVVAAIEVGGVPVGGPDPPSSAAAPSASKTMKTALITTAAIATLGLGAYAIAPRHDAESTPASATAPQREAASRPTEHPAPGVKPAAADPASAAPHQQQRDDRVSLARAAGVQQPFEVTRLGPSHVSVAIHGGKSPVTGGPGRAATSKIVGHVEGVVLSAEGQPVADAVIVGGPYLSLTFGQALGAQAGVQADAQGRFALPAFDPGDLALVAAHHEHGMSAVLVASTADQQVTLRLQPFTWLEGSVLEDGEGIPGRAALLGSEAPMVHLFATTEEDGTYRLGPIPPGRYTATASTSVQDPGTITHFPRTPLEVSAGGPTHHDYRAIEGAMLVLEATLAEDDERSLLHAVFTGERSIDSAQALRDLTQTTPAEQIHFLFRGGSDANESDATFQGLDAGTYTACLAVVPRGEPGSLDCRVVEVGESETKIVELAP